MMTYTNIDGMNIYYECAGNKRPVLLLHGWGQNTQMMDFIAKHLQQYFMVYNIDFPGFGKSSLPIKSMGVGDYCEVVRKFCLEHSIENPIIIGHSFGCRVAFHYASQYPVHKMVMTGAAGLRDKRGLSYYIKTYTYKMLKVFLKLPFLASKADQIKSHFGSADYKNSSGVMKETFVKCVNDDVSSLLGKVACEVLLVFGDKDEATPLWMGKKLEQQLPNSALVIFENDDHYAYFHQGQRFNRVLDAFFKEDYQ